MSMTRLFCWGGLASLAFVACGGTLRDGATFSGRSAAPIVAPEGVRVLRDLPRGFRVIGRVTAQCQAEATTPEFEGVWLSDLDCNVARLERALRERGAAVGGELLVGSECSSRPQRRAFERAVVVCRADVARSEDRGLGPRPVVAPPDASEAELARVSEAWRISVDATLDSRHPPRAPRRVDQVGELSYLPPSHVRLGDVVTRCERDCTEAGLRTAILTAAGHLGATDVVDLRCAERGTGLTCTASAAGYEVDPEVDPRAR